MLRSLSIQGVPTSLPEHNGVSPTGPPGTELTKNVDPAGNYQLIGQGYWDTLYPLGPSFVALFIHNSSSSNNKYKSADILGWDGYLVSFVVNPTTFVCLLKQLHIKARKKHLIYHLERLQNEENGEQIRYIK